MNADASAPALDTSAVPAAARRAPRVLRTLGQFARRKPLGAFGGAVVVVVLFVAVFGDVLAPHDPTETIGSPLHGPSADFPFGTDWLGRDTLSRVMAGARTSFFTASLVVLIAGCAGLFIGAASAYFGGTVDLVVQRVVESFQAIPLLIFGVAVVAIFGPHEWHAIPMSVVVALGIVFTPVNVRVIRASALVVLTQPFMEASRALGASDSRQIVRHLIPNLMAPLIVLASIQLGSAVIIEATLAFVGVGLPPPAPTWGGLLSGDARTYMRRHPEIAVFPGLALSTFVIGINFLGDAIRDVLDPRLRTGA
jgi:peptide/nickel transport system permease protein